MAGDASDQRGRWDRQATRQISEDGGSGRRRVRSARTVGVAGDALDQRGRWE